MSLNDWGRVTVSLVVTVGFVAVLVIVLTVKLQGNATPDVILVMLGALGGALTTVVGYWVGSSASSTAKDATISTMATK